MNWISTKEKKAPPMREVLLFVDGKTIVGWNESTEPEEDPVYCSWENWPDSISVDGAVTHWMLLPDGPKEQK